MIDKLAPHGYLRAISVQYSQPVFIYIISDYVFRKKGHPFVFQQKRRYNICVSRFEKGTEFYALAAKACSIA